MAKIKFKRRKPNKSEQLKLEAYRFGSNVLAIPIVLGIFLYFKDAIDWIFIQWGPVPLLVIIPLVGILILEIEKDNIENSLWEEVKK